MQRMNVTKIVATPRPQNRQIYTRHAIHHLHPTTNAAPLTSLVSKIQRENANSLEFIKACLLRELVGQHVLAHVPGTTGFKFATICKNALNHSKPSCACMQTCMEGSHILAQCLRPRMARIHLAFKIAIATPQGTQPAATDTTSQTCNSYRSTQM